MKATLLLLAVTTLASSMVVHDIRGTTDDGNSTLVAREPLNSYGLGVHIYTNTNCGGTILSDCNHDVSSCNYGCPRKTAYQWISVKAKPDGVNHGTGCVTGWSNADCTGRYTYSAIVANQCVNFGFNANCIVVANRNSDGSCEPNSNSCR